MTAVSQSEKTRAEQTVEIYLVRGYQELHVDYDRNVDWDVPVSWAKDVLDAKANHDVENLISGTKRHSPVGSVTVDSDGQVSKVSVNSKSVERWEQYAKVERKRPTTAESRPTSTDDSDDDEQEDHYEEATAENDEDDDTEEDEQKTVHEFDVILGDKQSTAGGRVTFEVKLVDEGVTVDIICPKLATKSDKELYVHACKRTGRDAARALRGRHSGERVATIYVSEEGVEEVSIAG